MKPSPLWSVWPKPLGLYAIIFAWCQYSNQIRSLLVGPFNSHISPSLDSRPFPWKFIYRNSFGGIFFKPSYSSIYIQLAAELLSYLMIVCSIFSYQGLEEVTWSHILAPSSRQSRVSNLCHPFPEYRRLSRYDIRAEILAHPASREEVKTPISHQEILRFSNSAL